MSTCNEIIGREVGQVCVHMYKETGTDLPFFYVEADNENVLQLSYVIEDTLYKY